MEDAEFQYEMNERVKNQVIVENFASWLEMRGEDEPFTTQDALIGAGFYDKENNYSYNQRKCIYNKIYYLSHSQEFSTLEQRGKYYRKINRELDELKWWESDENNVLDLKLPLGLHDYATFFRPCLIVIAGLYNQGKTAFMLNMLKLNLDTFANKLHLFVSEGQEQLKTRLANLGLYSADGSKFKAYRRLVNFSDVIDPDGLNLIDYLRVNPEKSFTVATDLFEIYSKLNQGVAVVALQKPPGRDEAYGGAWTAFDPAMYISIDKGNLKLVRVKTPRQTEIDIYKTHWEFKIQSGVNFVDVHRVTE